MKRGFAIIKIFTLFTLSSLLLFSSCDSTTSFHPEPVAKVDDLEDIIERGKLVVITDYNSVNYFIYQGQPLGFQYELLQELSDHLGLRLEVRVNNDLNQNFQSLINGECDLIASNLTITKARREMMDFTVPHSQSRMVLVQRNIDNDGNLQSSFISDVTGLGGKTVYVQKGSAYVSRLKHLSEEIGEKIRVVEVPVSVEQLIKLVANGDVEYTVADENLAQVNKNYFPDIDVELAVGFSQNLAWAVRIGAVDLKNEIDAWLEDFVKTNKYAVIYHKYFQSRQSVRIVNSQFFYPETGRISYYDDILKRESERIGWDWRLIASLVFQESRFNPDAVSHAGAFGLMQLMPQTAEGLGVNQNSTPAEHIRAGIRYIEWLDKRFSSRVRDDEERKKFILASYNAGIGHVLDAIRLTEKYGKNPEIWDDNVEYYLMKKSDPAFYTDEVVRSGYLRGTETYNFVRSILYRYNHYLNIEHLDLAQLFPQDQ